MSAITLYGIKNCDTMKKARAWLDQRGIAYAFHDYKVDGIEHDTLQVWMDKLGWEVLLNRAGTTFRALPEADRQGLDGDRALFLMRAYPSMIKRPVLVRDGAAHVGFKPELYEALFAA